MKHLISATTLLFAVSVTGCMASSPEGLATSQKAKTLVGMDFFNKPLPTIPLPNDVATRYDASSATKRRINASMIAPTGLERRVRQLFDRLDGWGVFQSITVPFTGPLDINAIIDAHHGDNYDLSNDVIYLVNVDRASEKFGTYYHLDVGNGNYPVVLEKADYWGNDPRGFTSSLLFEEADEDLNDNGRLDPGEDTDADGVLDKPNYLPGHDPEPGDRTARVDALMTFYERETNTLIVRPMIPLEERTTYAVVVTRRLIDADGEPVGSPFPYINDTSQTKALEALPEVLAKVDLDLTDVAFTWSFTTQTVKSNWVAVREGLYGHGVQKHIGEEFPAELSTLEKIRTKEAFPDMQNPYIMYTENWISEFKDVYKEVFEANTDGISFQDLQNGHQYIDYHVVGTFDSPQLFKRADGNGKWLPLHDQVWPEDLHSIPAKARGEKIHFWLTLPRKEVSARGEGKPAPLIILSHGYTSSRIEMLPFAGFFAKHGFATLSIDCVSHGVGVSELVLEAAKSIFGRVGLASFVEATLKDRAVDLNGDLQRDSGADFWTAYLFHTRDMVRQSALDYMQLIRIIRTFDGENRWQFDVNGAGSPGLAGDFDGDGFVDIGDASTIGMTGGSLGGIMSLVVGGVEPAVDVSVPIAGGGGLSDIGVRSQQGGVREAVVLRMFAPLYVGSMNPDKPDEMLVDFIVPDLNSWASRRISKVQGVKEGDTVVVQNLKNGKHGCGYVSPDMKMHVTVESDVGDPTNILFYSGNALVLGDTECAVQDGKEPYRTIDRFDRQIYFQGEYPANDGDPLIALAEGFGLRRGNPEVRRFMALAQVALDAADPAVIGRHMQQDPIHYPSTNETTGTHVMVVTTVGDMNVPASSGLSIGRALGLIDYLNPQSRLGGKTVNQVLLDTHTAEAVNTLKRYTFDGRTDVGVHMDVENFSQGTDMWADTIPRVPEPVRAGLLDGSGNAIEDAIGGRSGAIFPYANPTGQHGFDFPGELTDSAIKACRRACTMEGGDDPCECAALQKQTFDVGHFMFNVFGRYFRSQGKTVDFDLCNSRADCPDIPGTPETRDASLLR